MSAVEALKYALERIKPTHGESREVLARRLFNIQMEVYSSHAGRDLDGEFNFLTEKQQNSWFKLADEKLR